MIRSIAAALAIVIASRPLVAQKNLPYARPVTYIARTLGGDSLRIGDGEAVTLVNVFATWCTTCKTEIPTLGALMREYGPRGLRVVAVSVDEASSDHVRRFIEVRRVGFPVIHDSAGRVTHAFGTVGVPETYLVSRDGRIVWRHGGDVSMGLTGLRKRLDAVLR